MLKKFLIFTTLLAAAQGPAITILTDANRDGKLSEADRQQQQRALFLFNNDDDDSDGEPDWMDDQINGPQDLKDLARIVVKIPEELKSKNLKLTLLSYPEFVNFFQAEGASNYRLIEFGREGNLTIPDDADELELRIEGKTYADKSWDGWAPVTIIATAGETVSRASTGMIAAPWLMLPNTQEVQTVYVREFPERNDRFIEQLKEIVPAAGAELQIIPASEPYRPHHIWVQDTMEIGYSQLPGQEPMHVVLRANRGKALDDFPKNSLLGPNYGWFTRGEFREVYGSGEGVTQLEWLDWYGNLEVSPPVPGYPLGRAYYGGVGFEEDEVQLNPAITSMLDGQNEVPAQGPAVRFDVSWLVIKHVDEMFSFLPMPDGGMKVMVPDLTLSLDLMEEWQGRGWGDQSMLEPFQTGMTVNTVLADEELVSYNRSVQEEKIEPNIKLLMKEFSIPESSIIRVPLLLGTDKETLIPNMVNSLVINGHLVASDPRGPVVDGVDQLQAFFLNIMEPTGLRVHFADDEQYHRWSGNVHCATNARRQPYQFDWWAKELQQ